MKYKVLLQGVYGDMTTFHDVVEADNKIDALFMCDGAEYCFDQECWDFDNGDLVKDKLPKTLEEAKIMARKHDRIIDVTLKY